MTTALERRTRTKPKSQYQDERVLLIERAYLQRKLDAGLAERGDALTRQRARNQEALERIDAMWQAELKTLLERLAALDKILGGG